MDITQKKTIKEIIAEQYGLCAKDYKYFIKKYCFIQHPVRGKIPFILYEYQEKILDEFINHRYNIILKSRQLGLSTVVANYALWLMTFKKDQNILIIATGKDVAKNIISKINYAYTALPSWMKRRSTENNKMSISFDNGSKAVAISSSPERARSEAVSLLIIDECAFIDKIDEIWTSAQQTISTGGDCILLSTPNGVGNFFHSMWLDAEAGSNNFHTIKLKWMVHPERDQEWRDRQDIDLGKLKASQECDADFLASGNNVVDMGIITEYKTKFLMNPIQKSGIDNGLWIFKHPENNKSYVISADVARGDGTDYSAAQIFDIESLEQVAEYQGHIDTRSFAKLLASIGITYNMALIIVEREGIGWDTVQELIDINYGNLFYSSSDLQFVDVLHHYSNKLNRDEKKLKPGFGTTEKTRGLLISKIERYFTEKSLIIYSIRLLNELETFIWKNGKAQAQPGRNDDLVMSLGILLWVRDTALKLRNDGIQLSKMMISKIGKSTIDSLIYQKTYNDINPYKLRVGNNEQLDLTDYL